jgi:hypothetical protein
MLARNINLMKKYSEMIEGLSGCFQSVQCGILNAALFGSFAMAVTTKKRE